MNMSNTDIQRILLIDEHILFREGLASMLNSLPDFAVVGQAGLVCKAIEKAIELKPDIIIMDILCGDGSGADAIKLILAKSPNSKIVILTTHESDELFFAALQNGAKGYLHKDVPFNTLLASIRAMVRGETALSRAQFTRVLDVFARKRLITENGSYLYENLTEREMDVVKDLELGNTNREIADHLSITENTVKRHVHSILKKLGLRNRREVARYARFHIH